MSLFSRRWMALCLLVVGVLPGPGQAAQATDAPPIVPLPARWQAQAGRFVPGANTALIAQDAAAQRVAGQLVAWQRAGRLLVLPIRHSVTSSAAGQIHLHLDSAASVDQREGYVLDIRSDGIDLRARTEPGLFHGAVTLFQLLVADAGQGLPAMHIEDWPRFAWRGLMLDSARHYMPVEAIERLLDAMALYKLNSFHWHLTDDQGWRLQILRYPQLTDIGAWRNAPDPGPDGKAQRYGGYYTQDEVREVVAHAAALHINVVPEIDMPGHAQAAVAAMPQLGVVPAPGVSADWGVHAFLFGVDDDTLAVMRNILDEVMRLFPSPIIHVGGDEAIKNQWRASPAVQARMHALGIDDETALQGWFIGQIGRYLAAHGRRLIGWDEILDGPLPDNAVVMSWRGTEGAVTAAGRGHDVVLAPAPTLYLDNLESAADDEPAGRLAVQTLRTVYDFDPMPAGLPPAQAVHVLGAQVNLWTEYKTSPWHVFDAAFPRAAALAELSWTPESSRDWNGFVSRLAGQQKSLRALDVNPSDASFAVAIRIDDRAAALDSGQVQVSLSTPTDTGVIHYTVDGSAPTRASPRYGAPLHLPLGTLLRARSYTRDGLPLSESRSRRMDRQQLLSRSDAELRNCSDGGLRLRVPLRPDSPQTGPAYDVDLFDACWIYPDASLNRVTGLRIEGGNLAFNFQLPGDEDKVIRRPSASGSTELEVRSERCLGPLLDRVALPGLAVGQPFRLTAHWSPRPGITNLCLRFNGIADESMPAIGSVELIESAGVH